MRTIGLLLLTFFFPAFAHAALLNINTADATLLDTLPGIGPAYATRIVEYRTAHGPFARIEDIQNVSGIGPSTYAGIAPLITVGDTSTPDTGVASTTTSISTSSGSATTYIPPPSAISVEIRGSHDAMLEVPLRLFAHVTTKSGAPDISAQISWSFGDGSSSSGSSVEKTYRYTGTYLIVATANDGSARAQGDIIVTVRSAKVHLSPVSGEGITIVNDSNERLDLSGWRLLSETGSFKIPDGTVLLPEASVLFPFTITNLPSALEATLLYPNGIIAARSPAQTRASSPVETEMQPFEPATSFNEVQKVELITSPKANIQDNEKAVLAPTAATELAAVGAAFSAENAPLTSTRGSHLFRSPWTLGFLGVMTIAAGAFILL